MFFLFVQPFSPFTFDQFERIHNSVTIWAPQIEGDELIDVTILKQLAAVLVVAGGTQSW